MDEPQGLYWITYKGSRVANSLPVDQETGNTAIALLVAEEPWKRLDYDLDLFAVVVPDSTLLEVLA